MIINTIRLRAHFKEDIADKIAADTTDGKPYYRIKAELSRSELFDYGNRTGTCIEIENLPAAFQREYYIDTRYVSGITSDFAGWVTKWLEANYRLDHVEVLPEILCG